MRASAAALLVLAGCASEPEIPPVTASTLPSEGNEAVSTIQPFEGNCREFTVPIRVGNEEKQAYGRACERPDGSWQIMPPAGAPQGQPQTVIEHTHIYPNYYGYGGWGWPWWGPLSRHPYWW
jgi:hypothetical protein